MRSGGSFTQQHVKQQVQDVGMERTGMCAVRRIVHSATCQTTGTGCWDGEDWLVCGQADRSHSNMSNNRYRLLGWRGLACVRSGGSFTQQHVKQLVQVVGMERTGVCAVRRIVHTATCQTTGTGCWDGEDWRVCGQADRSHSNMSSNTYRLLGWRGLACVWSGGSFTQQHVKQQVQVVGMERTGVCAVRRIVHTATCQTTPTGCWDGEDWHVCGQADRSLSNMSNNCRRNSNCQLKLIFGHFACQVALESVAKKFLIMVTVTL